MESMIRQISDFENSCSCASWWSLLRSLGRSLSGYITNSAQCQMSASKPLLDNLTQMLRNIVGSRQDSPTYSAARMISRETIGSQELPQLGGRSAALGPSVPRASPPELPAPPPIGDQQPPPPIRSPSGPNVPPPILDPSVPERQRPPTAPEPPVRPPSLPEQPSVPRQPSAPEPSQRQPSIPGATAFSPGTLNCQTATTKRYCRF